MRAIGLGVVSTDPRRMMFIRGVILGAGFSLSVGWIARAAEPGAPCGHADVVRAVEFRPASSIAEEDTSGSVDPPSGFSWDACGASCLATADRSLDDCVRVSGDAVRCADTLQAQVLACFREQCPDGGAQALCDTSCHWQAERVFDRCGPSPEPAGLPCAERSREIYRECALTHCGFVVPAPPCETRCFAQGRAAFEACVRADGRPEVCAMNSRLIVDQCLAGLCQLPPPRPSCETHCEDRALRVKTECLLAGEPALTCTRNATDARQRCLENECGLSPVCAAGCTRQRLFDPRGDAERRNTVPEPVDYVPPRNAVIDLLDITLGTWMPHAPRTDLFDGQFRPDGLFVRIDLRLDGLVNPPGSLDPFSFSPFAYGPRPVYGFVEIDVDRNVATGGEVHFPQYRFLMNAARFGGLPTRQAFRDRVAAESAAVDNLFHTPPFVERHGEEFHLSLLGGQEWTITERSGNGDRRFESGESWLLRGSFFHRAHGFEPFSLATGGRVAGEYAPDCDLLFRHDVVEDVTIVSIVFPLTNAGAALVQNRPTEASNGNPRDQASILEALDDLTLSAQFLALFPSGLAAEALIRGWAGIRPADHLNPALWSITALVGTAPPALDRNRVPFVWTDIYPNVVTGDVDGNGARTDADFDLIDEKIRARDPADGSIDGAAVVPGFPIGFSVFDVDYDGRLTGSDVMQAEGDTDGDGDVDLADMALLQRCYGSSGAFPPCLGLNLMVDERVDERDLPAFLWLLSGPGGF